MQSWPGKSYPLGSTLGEEGTNFALFSQVATAVELCLFDDQGEETRLPITEVDAFIWHIFVPGIKAGQRYGFRVSGPWDPAQGVVCNPAKLLLDPYAKAICGDIEWGQAVFGYTFGEPQTANAENSAPFTMMSVVADTGYDWSGESRPQHAYRDLVIYEAHVKGLTETHPDIPENIRGTYAAVAHPAITEHLKSINVNAIELLPVHQFINDDALIIRGLTNYWGYNTLGFLAPEHRYSASGACGEQITEFKDMVKGLHNAGIEVILDVVYNHTAEGSGLGPTLNLRGIDNPSYYRLDEKDKSVYVDYTGTGNSLNVRSPHTLQLIMDSLRYWVTEMHVDGFRFDLASTLARDFYDVDRLSSFFDLIQQDPVISQTKLIAEPWDLGPGGYQVGNFPPKWSEWNGKYRDTVRDFWRSEPATIGELASRLTGSSDLYQSSGRTPMASINFVTAHDGFTLRDLVSYNEKHNQANGEDNRDGTNDNRSWNCGVEGDTDDGAINSLRARQQRNFWTTLLLSQGVPMISHGDELGRTQLGNNNTYAQDNELSWIDWAAADQDLLTFARAITGLRAKHPTFRRRGFFTGDMVRGANGRELPDIVWLEANGNVMEGDDWSNGNAKTLGMFLNGDGIRKPDERGERIVDDSFILYFNADGKEAEITIPDGAYGARWVAEINTGSGNGVRSEAESEEVSAGDTLAMAAHSALVLRCVAP